MTENMNEKPKLLKNPPDLNKIARPNWIEINLDALCNIKSREELIADIVALLQSPVKNVISALQSQGGGKIAGIVKTLSEK